jgi:hypothetical protein
MRVDHRNEELAAARFMGRGLVVGDVMTFFKEKKNRGMMWVRL